jgi:hypothetical protein
MAKGKGSKAGGKGKTGAGPRAPALRLTPAQLLEQAQLALQFDDFDAARMALRKAVKLDPRNVECLDALGALLAEVGPEEEAVEVCPPQLLNQQQHEFLQPWVPSPSLQAALCRGQPALTITSVPLSAAATAHSTAPARPLPSLQVLKQAVAISPDIGWAGVGVVAGAAGPLAEPRG